MSNPKFNRDQSRRVDRIAIEHCGMTGLVLMENAGRGLADLLEQLGLAGSVVICCGKGNNGGDGFVAARHLSNRGYRVKVFLWASPEDLQGDAAANYAILRHCEVPIEQVDSMTDAREDALQAAAWLVDALLGTGATGPPRPPYDRAIRAMNASGSKILAADIPSGLDCDTGLPADDCIRALHTGTFVTEKIGFAQPTARPYLGNVHVLDIGVPRPALSQIR